MKIEDIPRRDEKLAVLERALDLMGRGMSFFAALEQALCDYGDSTTVYAMRNRTPLGPDTVAIIRDHPETLFGPSHMLDS